MKRTTIPTAVAIGAAGALGFAALPATAAAPSATLPPTSAFGAQNIDLSNVAATTDVDSGTAAELNESGVEVTVTGLAEAVDPTISWSAEADGEDVGDWFTAGELVGGDDSQTTPFGLEIPEDFTGTITVTVTVSEGGEDPDDDVVIPLTIDVTDVAPEVALDFSIGGEGATEGTAAEVNEQGVVLSGSGADTVPEGADTAIRFVDADGTDISDWFTGAGGSGGDGSFTTGYDAALPEDFTGTVTAQYLADDEVVGEDSINVVADAPAERQLVIEPEEVTAADFVNEDKGVQIAANGFAEGEVVTLEVTAGPENVEGVELTEVADENGIATFAVYGTNASQPSVYIGSYEVEVTGADDAADDEDPLTGSFEVVAGSGSGDDESGEAGGSGDLPRTGAELGGLGLGLGLLVAGGAAVLLSTRRAKVANGPADV